MADKPMTFDDLVFYVGFIGGAAAGSLTLRAYQAQQWVVLLGAIGCGVVLGLRVRPDLAPDEGPAARPQQRPPLTALLTPPCAGRSLGVLRVGLLDLGARRILLR